MKLLGSTGSRLLTGHSMHVNQLEIYLAKFHKSQDGIIFNSGFDANYGLFSCIANVNDCFLVDELIHSSVHEGIKGSRCKYWKSFKHNDTIDLKIKIDQFRFISNGHIFIAIESIYSMDGCLSKLKEITDLLDTYTDVHLIIDEAHSTGICGPNGSGLVCELELQDKVLARVHTFGKAIGCHGAIILGSTILKEYLINYAKPLIFSTFLPLHTLISIRLSYEYMIDHYEELYPMLKSRIVLFRKLLQPYRDIPLLDSNSPIQGNIHSTCFQNILIHKTSHVCDQVPIHIIYE
ncbi:pyridoxal phosphate-dependent transferase [Globomyces pollinis-pini]|nr:pyridoxal phosphate-dependent transferase [Globomyces pollinis-pini]